MDLRIPTLIKFLNRSKSGTAAENKIYTKGIGGIISGY